MDLHSTGISRAIAVLPPNEGVKVFLCGRKFVSVGVPPLMTQPRRTMVQQHIIAPRMQARE
ncbi:hypothetical protein BH10PSE13_BH10PSE13_08130 [soil metagenome]